MKKLTSLLLLLCLVSCNRQAIISQSSDNSCWQHDIEKSWVRFVEALSQNNVNELRLLSAQKIRCPLCLHNTDQEDVEMQKFIETNPNWYNDLYDKKIFIPLDTFINEDVPIIFNKNVIEKMKAAKVNYVECSMDGKPCYEIPVMITRPGEFAPGDEGVQYLFLFVQTPEGYKFSGIDTIP